MAQPQSQYDGNSFLKSFAQWDTPTVKPMDLNFGYKPPMVEMPGFGDTGVTPGSMQSGGLFGGVGTGVTAPGTDWMSSLSKFLGGSKGADGTQSMGAGGMLLGGAQALASLWSGMKNYGLMKDQLAFSKDSFNKNYEAQRTTTNASLEDRQAARVASNPGAYQSVSDYMAKNGIKG